MYVMDECVCSRWMDRVRLDACMRCAEVGFCLRQLASAQTTFGSGCHCVQTDFAVVFSSCKIDLWLKELLLGTR